VLIKKVLEIVGFVALVQGVLGLVREFTHWHVGMIGRLPFLHDYEVFASFVLIVLACALFAVTDSGGPRPRARKTEPPRAAGPRPPCTDGREP
jgi:hypothetical protein